MYGHTYSKSMDQPAKVASSARGQLNWKNRYFHPEPVKLGLCSWHTLAVPPMLQLAQSSHASSLYSTRVLLARTTCTAVDAACAIFARLKPLLDPWAPGVDYLFPRWYSLCTLRIPQTLTKPVCSWRELLVPPFMQLVYSSNVLGLYSTRVPWKARSSPPMLQLVQPSNASDLYSTRVP